MQINRYLTCILVALAFFLGARAAFAQDETVDGPPLEPVVISEDSARTIRQQLVDVQRFVHSLGISQIAKDDRLEEYAQKFLAKNQIEVLTIGYIELDELWPRIFKQIRLKKIEKAKTDKLLVAKIIFVPEMTEGKITGYMARLEIEGRTTEVYELLGVDVEVIELISEEANKELPETYTEPKEARELVVSVLLSSLHKINQKANPPAVPVTQVTFQPHPDQTYGFDAPAHEALQGDYPATVIDAETVRPPWKSLKSHTPDQVIVSDPAGQKLKFIHDNVELQGIPGEEEGTYQLTLTGAGDGTDGILLVAAGGEYATVGVLNTISYDQVINKVKVVPVNGAGANLNQSTLQQALNEIYGPAVASWTVEVLPNQNLGSSWDSNGDGALDDGETGMLSNYTGEMDALIKEFKRNNDRDRSAYYVFLVDKPETSGKLGYMPRKKQYGFVFTSGQSEEKLTKTIAHELGHGVFRLEHTFTERGLPKGQTDNLMDYSEGMALYKYQWDYVHDPASVVTLFDEEEEAAMEIPKDLQRVLDILSHSGLNYFAFVAKCQSTEEVDGNIYYIGGVPYKVAFLKYSYVDNQIQIEAFDASSLPADIGSAVSSTTLSVDQTKDQFVILQKSTSKGETSFLCNNLTEDYQTACSEASLLDIDNFFTKVASDIQKCINDSEIQPDGYSADEITTLLTNLESQMRSNQRVDFYQNGDVYGLDESGVAKVVDNPISREDIDQGDWTDSGVDIRFRVTLDDNGNLQYSALGIRSSLELFEDKSADLISLAQDVKTSGNSFFSSYSVKSSELTPSQEGLNLDSSGELPGGGKVDINEESSFWKISCEGLGLMGTLLKQGIVEEQVYNEDTESTIKAPSICTGSLEGGVRSVTDVTGMVVMIYDLSVDAQVREQTVQGFVAIKDQISDDPTQLFPILGEVVLEEATGITISDIQEINDLGLDHFRAQHLTSRGMVRGAITVVVGGRFLAQLPDMARKVAVKMVKAQLRLRLRGITGITADAVKSFSKKLDDLGDLAAEFLDDFSAATDDVLAKFVQRPSLMDTWRTIRSHVSMRKHVNTLEKLTDLYEDSDFISKLPNGKSDLDDIIDAVKSPFDEGTDVKLVKLSEHLENLRQVIKKHPDADGIERLLTDLKNPAFAMQDGVTHMLNDVKNLASGRVKKFDYEFDGDGVACTKCRFDVELSSGTPKLIEYKSWSLENIPNISSKQLTEYFRSATSIGDIKYVFNKLKTPSVADVKSQFQVIIGDNAKMLFEANPQLFKTIKNPDGTPLIIQNWQQLEGFAKKNPAFYKSSLFDFIEIK